MAFSAVGPFELRSRRDDIIVSSSRPWNFEGPSIIPRRLVNIRENVPARRAGTEVARDREEVSETFWKIENPYYSGGTTIREGPRRRASCIIHSLDVSTEIISPAREIARCALLLFSLLFMAGWFLQRTTDPCSFQIYRYRMSGGKSRRTSGSFSRGSLAASRRLARNASQEALQREAFIFTFYFPEYLERASSINYQSR